jgi:uncharacterized damage-inducible protein DinB
MPLNQYLLTEFDQEMANTRKMLERVPQDQLSFKPHPKSMDMRSLAIHLATIPGWGAETLTTESLDIAPPGAPPYKPPEFSSQKELLDIFDDGVKKARAAIEGASDEALLTNWSLLQGGQVLFTMPRMAVLRTLIMNHIIHHRAQLGVYLRLTGVAVPGMYGPSADEMQAAAS